MGASNGSERRSLKYIRLAAFLAAQPEDVERIEMSIGEIEGVVGEKLPPNARFPSWWRNDERRMHSRAWLSAGWEVIEMGGDRGHVVFVRQEGARPSRIG
ncbi:MAG: DUF7662 domain-containing protein [Actinomycetota bacterium]